MTKTVLLALAVTVAAPAHSAGASAQDFLNRAERLKTKGALAFFDSDYGRLKVEATAAGKSIENDRVAGEKAGRPILYCSQSPHAELGNFEFIRGLEAIPPGELQRMTLKDAMLRVLERKYPCRT